MLPIYQRTATDDSGDILPGASYTVLNESTGLDQAIYSDRAGLILKNGPTYSADSEGVVEFYVEPGEYAISVTSGGISRAYRYQVVTGTAAERDIGEEPTQIPPNSTVLAYIADAEKQSKSITIDVVADSDITLTDDQNLYGQIKITDSGGTLTGDINLIVSDNDRLLNVVNDTDYQIKVKTLTGTGVHVPHGDIYMLMCDGTNVLTNGSENNLVVLSAGSYSSGTYSYPNSLDQYAFSNLDMTVRGASLGTRSFTRITSEEIDFRPSAWDLQSQTSTDTAQFSIIVSYDTDTSFTIGSQMGGVLVSLVKAKLKHGVTY